MRWFRWASALCLAAALLLLPASLAEAHARLSRPEPSPNSVVRTAPDQLRVWFTEGLSTRGSSLEVVDRAGARVDRRDSRVDVNDPQRKLMVVSLAPLPNGTYTVRWQAVSSGDGHS